MKLKHWTLLLCLVLALISSRCDNDSDKNKYWIYIPDIKSDTCEMCFYLNDGTEYAVVSKCIREYNSTPKGYCLYEGVAPSRSGYSFLGWSQTQDGDVVIQPDETIIVDHNDTYYAVWSKIENETNTFSRVTFKYFDNYAVTKVYATGETLTELTTFKPFQYTPAGKELLGWSTDPNGKTLLQDYVVEGDATLYAIWKNVETSEDVYHIVFNLNGGSGATPSEITVKRGEKLCVSSLPSSGFAYSIYTFMGWSDSKNGVALTSDFTPTDNMVLYAVWSAGQAKDKTKD